MQGDAGSRRLQQPGGDPGHFLAPVGQDHRGLHRLGIAPHLEVQQSGAPGHGRQEGVLRRGGALQAHHHDLAGQGELPISQAGREIGRQLSRRQPAALRQQPPESPGNLAPPGDQGPIVRGRASPVERASPPAINEWRQRILWVSSRAWAQGRSALVPDNTGVALMACTPQGQAPQVGS